MAETGIPGTPMNAAVPPWAMMGMQLLDAILNRLRDESRGPRDGRGPPDAAGLSEPPDPGDPGAARVRAPRSAGPADAGRLARSCRILARRNERLARALGACRCWGRNPECPRCGGRGRPGTLDVDPAAFAEVVLPLLQAQPELFLRHVQPEVEVVPMHPRAPPAPGPAEGLG